YRETACSWRAGVWLSGWSAASAQPSAVALGEGPWEYTTFERGTRVRVSVVARDFAQPWSMAFLPGPQGEGRGVPDALITEKGGRVRLLRDGSVLAEPVADLADVFELDQLFDMALHPGFADNGLVYFAYTKKRHTTDPS